MNRTRGNIDLDAIALLHQADQAAFGGFRRDMTARFNAVNLVRVASEALGGKGGGGRPDMAQAGGPDGAKANAALDAIAAAMAAA
jgi:alanyl-tRNA synthetase